MLYVPSVCVVADAISVPLALNSLTVRPLIPGFLASPAPCPAASRSASMSSKTRPETEIGITSRQISWISLANLESMDVIFSAVFVNAGNVCAQLVFACPGTLVTSTLIVAVAPCAIPSPLTWIAVLPGAATVGVPMVPVDDQFSGLLTLRFAGKVSVKLRFVWFEAPDSVLRIVNV